MSGTDEGGWYYLGEHAVGSADTNRISIPEGVFDVGVLPHPEETDREEISVYWAYEQVVGFLIMSNRELRNKPDYKPQGSVKLQAYPDGYRATIPIVFFKEEGPAALPPRARVRYGESRYFVARDPMVEGDIRSCYLLTRDQLENAISTPDEWEGSFDSIPRFLRG